MRGTGCRLHVHWPDDEMFARTGMTISAGFGKVGGIHGGARVGRREDVVHAMAGRAVGHALRAFSRSQTVIAVGVGRDTVGGQIVAQLQALVVMAAAAGGHGDTIGVDQRSLLFRAQD